MNHHFVEQIIESNDKWNDYHKKNGYNVQDLAMPKCKPYQYCTGNIFILWWVQFKKNNHIIGRQRERREGEMKREGPNKKWARFDNT